MLKLDKATYLSLLFKVILSVIVYEDQMFYYSQNS